MTKLNLEDQNRLMGSYIHSGKLSIYPVSVYPSTEDVFSGITPEIIKLIMGGIYPKFQLVLIDLAQIKFTDAVNVGKILVGDTKLTGMASNSSSDLEAALAYIGEAAVQFHFLSISPYTGDYDTAQSRGIICEPKVGQSIMMADYLRSKGYHIPFMGENLFESGKAIKAKKPW